MKLIIDKKLLTYTSEKHLQLAGYAVSGGRGSDERNFVRRLGRGFYPRFHVYLKEDGDKVTLNLHLDQKKPSYSGARAHNADYDGEVLEEEVQRLKSLIGNS